MAAGIAALIHIAYLAQNLLFLAMPTNHTMPQQVACRFYAPATETHWKLIQDELYADPIMGIEPLHPYVPSQAEGPAAFRAEGKEWQQMMEEHYRSYCVPLVTESFFSSPLGMAAKRKWAKRSKLDEVAVYRVA